MTLTLVLASPLFAADTEQSEQDSLTAAEREEVQRQREAMMASIERSRQEVERVAEEARQKAETLRQDTERLRAANADLASESEQARQAARAALAREREELRRTHRELRRASQEVVRAHRALSLAEDRRIRTRTINLGDRAMIGVILGEVTEDGVKIIGLSPDGPAERAGIETGDIITTIRGESVLPADNSSPRDVIYEVLNELGEGEEIAVGILRDNQPLSFMVKPEKREPASWASYIRLPEPVVAPAMPGSPDAPEAVTAPHVLIEKIALPPIDTSALAAEALVLAEELENFQIVIEGDDGETSEFAYSFNLDPSDFEFDTEVFSSIGSRALDEASLWFGSGATLGLRFTDINEGLAGYFDTDSGILVLEAPQDNAFGLMAGDVVLKVGDHNITGASDFVRALRDHESGQSVELHIKRDKRDVSYDVVIPENRFGFFEEHLAGDGFHTIARKVIRD